ncbi:MAG: glucosaminidase domain-containing protein [Fastidiosipilaceae bacterium]
MANNRRNSIANSSTHRSRQKKLTTKSKFGLILAAVFVVIVAISVVVIARLNPPLPPLHINLQQPILDEPTATVEQAQKWARSRNATETFVELAPIYWSLAPNYGINPVVAYAQAGLETNYGRFGGVVDATYCNPCGLKTTQGGDDSDPQAHQRFPDWTTGITAHLEHLALYAGAKGYPLENPLDPRHFPRLLGTARTVGEIGENWASSDYYANLLAELIDRMEVQHVPGQTAYPRSSTLVE